MVVQYCFTGRSCSSVAVHLVCSGKQGWNLGYLSSYGLSCSVPHWRGFPERTSKTRGKALSNLLWIHCWSCFVQAVGLNDVLLDWVLDRVSDSTLAWSSLVVLQLLEPAICVPALLFTVQGGGGCKASEWESWLEAACSVLPQIGAEVCNIPVEWTVVSRVWIGL